MPRPTREPVTRTPSATPVRQQQRPQVQARPVDALAVRGVDTSLDQTLKGLSQFNTNLSQFVEAKADADLQEGMKTRADGSPLSEDASEWFKHGYMVMDGQVKGQEDGTSLRTAYLNDFDREGGDVERLISDTWASKARGLTDKSFLSGYSRSFADAAQQVRKDHLEYQQERLTERHHANATALIDATVRGHVERGEEVPQVKLETLKGEMRKYGIGYKKYNELLFVAVNRYGMESGNFAVYDLFKRPNSDGTPGAYFIPAFKEKIDAAQVRAQNIFLEKQATARRLAEKAREDKQDEALYSTFEKLYSGDSLGAQNAFRQHVESGLFSRASDLVKWQEMFRKVDNRELRQDEQVLMTGTLAGIYTGRIGIRQILDSGLPPQATRQLLSEWRTVVQQNRQAAADDRANGEQPFKSHVFKEQEDWIEGQLKPSQDFMGRFTNRNDFISGARASAKLELAEYVRAHGLKDIRTKTLEIVQRHVGRISDFDINRLGLAAKQLRYSTVSEAKAAFDRGVLTQRDFALHLDYFENRQKQKRAQEARKK
jgi:hypothetical protein